MASELYVDKITGKTGTSAGAPITISGDTATLGSGVTNNAGVASGTIGSAVTGSPALTAPALGTPVSGILTNCTGIQLPYMKLSGGSCSISSSWNVVNWTVLDSSSLATYSSGVFTFTATGAGTYLIIASLNAYHNSADERWFGVQIWKNSGAVTTSYQGLKAGLDGDSAYANPVATTIESYAEGDTFQIKSASSSGGTATFYGTSHCTVLKVG